MIRMRKTAIAGHSAPFICKARILLAVLLGLPAVSAMAAETESEVGIVEEIVVSGELSTRLGEVGSWSAVDADELDLIGATHPTEALVRVPGASHSIARRPSQIPPAAIPTP